MTGAPSTAPRPPQTDPAVPARGPIGSRWTAPGLVALATVLVHAATNGRYGFFRDELYFIACGRHPSWGYVDQPPLAPLISAASMWLSGPDRLWLYRMPAALGHGGLVLLTGLFARRLGGGTFASVVAALGSAFAPLLLVHGHILSMNSFEALLVLSVVTCAVAILDGGDRRLWLLAGALIGVGLLNKHSMVFFAASSLLALAILPTRRELRSRWTALGAAAALLIALPHAVWQLRAGLPMLELLRNGQLYKNAPFELATFLKGQFVEMNPIVSLIWLSGLLWLLLAGEARRHRFVGVMYLLVLALMAAMRAKVYYVAPAYPMLIAAGGVCWEKLARPLWARLSAIAAVAAAGLAIAPIVIPMLTPPQLIRWQDAIGIRPARLERHQDGPLTQHFADQFGWERMVERIAAVWNALPPEDRAHGTLFVTNYGEAAALDLFGPRLGLPPASSGHNQYFLWGPHGEGQPLLQLDRPDERARQLCASLEPHGTAGRDPLAMPYENDREIWICRGLKAPFSQVWPHAKHYE